MTLYSPPNCDFHPSGCIEVIHDASVWQSGEEYHFVGATLANGKWKTNALRWNEYYIMTSDQGIRILYTKYGFQVALMKKGKEILVAHVDRTSAEAAERNSFFESTKSNPLGTRSMHWSGWHATKTALKTVQPSDSAQEILSAMEAWEETSFLTLLWVENALRNQLQPRDTKQVFVAGHHWLWYNVTKGVAIIGHGQNIWGSAHLHSGKEAIGYVALLPRGDWLVSITSHDKYLLHWNGCGVEARAFVFPWGPWCDVGEWRFWYTDLSILTPENQLVMIPSQSDWRLRGQSPNWACFLDWDSREQALLINCGGKPLDLDLSGCYTHNEEVAPWFCPGEQHVLIFHYDNRDQGYISLVKISPVEEVERCPCPLWQVMIDPYDLLDFSSDPVYLKDENEAVEVFAFAFSAPDDRNYGICLINERGEFWISPLLFKDAFLDYHASTDRAAGRDKPAIAVHTTSHKQDFVCAIIRVLNGQGHMQLYPGITLSGPFIPIPEGKEGLWPYLASTLGIERTPETK